jgi:hypothetical protein
MSTLLEVHRLGVRDKPFSFRLLFFGSNLTHQSSNMQEGLHMLCDEFDTIVVMDQITRDVIETGIPGFVLSKSHILVVPPGEKHDDDSVYQRTYTLKKDICNRPRRHKHSYTVSLVSCGVTKYIIPDFTATLNDSVSSYHHCKQIRVCPSVQVLVITLFLSFHNEQRTQSKNRFLPVTRMFREQQIIRH